MSGRGEIAVAEVSLRGTILRAGPGTENGGKCDGDQDADDENDHHKLDEREARFLVPAPRREGCGHSLGTTFRGMTDVPS